MIILHTGLNNGNLYLWAEKSPQMETDFTEQTNLQVSDNHLPEVYPFAGGTDDINTAIKSSGLKLKLHHSQEKEINLLIPAVEGVPIPSSPMIQELPESEEAPVISPWMVNGFCLEKEQIVDLLSFAENREVFARGIIIGKDLFFWTKAFRFALWLIENQKYLPGLIKENSGSHFVYRARWEPLISGSDTQYFQNLAESMPDSCRAVAEKSEDTAIQPVSSYLALSEFVGSIVDHLVRSSNPRRSGRTKFESIHDYWLYSLTSSNDIISGTDEEIEEFAEQIQNWRYPVEISKKAPFNLCFRLEEPVLEEDDDGADAKWKIKFFIQFADDQSLLIPVKDAWKPDRKMQELLDVDGFNYREFLLHAFGRAAEITPLMEEGLKSSVPDGYEVDITDAFNFLTEKSWMLEQSGFTVFLPAWWSRKGRKRQINASAQVKSPKLKSAGFISLGDVIEFDWKLALGDEPLSYEELQALAKMKSPLVRFRGQWTQLNAEEIKEALEFWKKKESKTTLKELIKMEIGISNASGGIPIKEVKATGWIADFLKDLKDKSSFKELEQPELFNGELRPYQKKGYSWLHFIKKWGLGSCLADDMGLGKTIQVLSLVARDWMDGNRQPVLIICPTSVMGNWKKEASKFTPELPVMIHHGHKRTSGENFVKDAKSQAIVISSYALIHRDFKHFEKVSWGGIILDEAQNIKNPETKQAKSARSLNADYRIALTGTPVENHVGDLWSIMEFLNPGFLGRQSEFKEKFHAPIHVTRDKEAEEKLKRITTPFILRRLKTDKSIISDLPDKMEMKVYCTMTKEQASLYSATASEMIDNLHTVDGIQKKGMVLATISKLKQICNHPLQFLADNSTIPQRSGKLERLVEMMEEIIESGEKALVFTQFAEMGGILRKYLQETFGKEVFFLHGGTPQKKREYMVEQFQNNADSPDIFILSLKAGGTGLNLTRANHVFHFDRWWNPAVENQATDRVFRIGQSKNVEVHKFVCLGTIEERIDEMIEQKKEISESIVGTGEGWITELSNSELREIFTLRNEAIGE
jgi:SNF2 family DNA or RNA helicase